MNKCPSAYKEVGLLAALVCARTRRLKAVDAGLFSDDQRRLRKNMHSWDLTKSEGGRQTTRSQPCTRCGQPRFVVEGDPCRGKPKRSK